MRTVKARAVVKVVEGKAEIYNLREKGEKRHKILGMHCSGYSDLAIWDRCSVLPCHLWYDVSMARETLDSGALLPTRSLYLVSESS